MIFFYPWAVNFRALGLFGFIEMLVFVGILLVGYVYIWKKGSVGMGLESKLGNMGVVTTRLEDLINWGRTNAMWPLGLVWRAAPSR